MSGAQSRLLADGRRLHLQHGPIDIVAEAFGAAVERQAAYEQAARRFEAVLDELVGELDLLRRPIGAAAPLLRGPVARRMAAACRPHGGHFLTPMAAVAGAVADEVLAAMVAGRSLAKAYVNNGGDIAFHLAPGESLSAGIVDDQDAPAIDGRVRLDHALPVRGIATSGWRGRSHSLGIADAVTVLAADAAMADAAATLIANAVDADHSAVRRMPANRLRDETDLGQRLVTVAVGSLPSAAVAAALGAGEAAAEAMRRKGLIVAAYLSLQGEVRVVGDRVVPSIEDIKPSPVGRGSNAKSVRGEGSTYQANTERFTPHPSPLPTGEGVPASPDRRQGLSSAIRAWRWRVG